MKLPAEAVHLPFEAGRYRMAMGLLACAPEALIELDDQYPEELNERKNLLETRKNDVLSVLPEAAEANFELLQRLGTLLPTRFPAWFSRDGVMLHNYITNETWNLAEPALDPLEIAGRLVQEDLCLLRPGPDGPVLVSAVLCFPSRWSLAEKIGRPMAAIHAPVPFYGDRLARPVDRLMATLKPGRLVERFNWSVVDDAALFQPAGHGRRAHNAAITAANAGSMLFLRVERQTLSLLPDSGAVLFSIRIHRYPLARIAAQPAVAANLHSAVEALPAEMAAYKSIPPFRDALLAYLAGRAAA
ncbi:MAG TPA: DUF3445 domain-containing protein [Acetobacteraceae bacterium]|nr:DUF3445 domain-containing protein [Acetobacteraceae bacterium]